LQAGQLTAAAIPPDLSCGRIRVVDVAGFTVEFTIARDSAFVRANEVLQVVPSLRGFPVMFL
jgi:hypothetical protein